MWNDANPHQEAQRTVGCPHYRALAAPDTAPTLHATRPGCCGAKPGKRGREGVLDVEDLAGVVHLEDLKRHARGEGEGGENARRGARGRDVLVRGGRSFLDGRRWSGSFEGVDSASAEDDV